jgi:protein SCO1
MKRTIYTIILCLLTACGSKKQVVSGDSIFNLPSSWNTEEGKTIQLHDLKGKVLVVVMIYTTCKVACPRLVADMLDIRRKVPVTLKNKVQYVLVSIDPENDTPKKLKEFAISKEMDSEEWTFLQGNPETVREFANVLSVKYKEVSPMQFSHANIISIFNPGGELVHQQEGLGVNNNETIAAIIKAANQE